MKNNLKIKVLLVEDHKIVRMGLKALLEMEDNIEVVGEADNGVEAIRKYEEVRPDIMVMDIAMPMLNGLEATRQIIKKYPQAKILLLSAHSDDGYIEKAISLGVSGFLIKQCSPNYLMQALMEINIGKKYFSSTVLSRINADDGSSQQKKIKPVKFNLLSARETQVLQLIAEGLANKQIASELSISIKTVEKHRQNLMKKLNIHDTAAITRYAIAEGIIECSTQKTII